MRIYFNTPQRLTQLIGANTTVIVAGRRTGKTDSIASPFVLRNMQRMPGSTGGIVVPTFKHGLTNTIPGLLAAWRRWGFINGIHYVVGRRPPKSFQQAIIEPTDYEHVISFYNGSRAIIISQDRPGSSNSLTLSWLLIDEAKFIDYQRLKDETLPANGGIKSYFGRHSFNHSILILSDMPQTKAGSWFLHYKDKMDTELIHTIEATVYEIWRLKQRIRDCHKQHLTPPAYLRKQIRTLDRQLNQMRSVAVYYKEYSSIENLQLLGENYIKQMKRDLTPLTFQTSILCQRIGIMKDGFYSSMRESHKYDASNFAYLDSLAWNSFNYENNEDNENNSTGDVGAYGVPEKPALWGVSLARGNKDYVRSTTIRENNHTCNDHTCNDHTCNDHTCNNHTCNAQSYINNANLLLDSRADADINPDAPICIGMDYNANINWIVAAQPSTSQPLSTFSTSPKLLNSSTPKPNSTHSTSPKHLNTSTDKQNSTSPKLLNSSTPKPLLILKSFYTKFDRKIPALIDDFCRYYQFHRNKTVIYYYDATALGSNYAVNDQDFHWVVCHEFERHGWQVDDVYLGNPMRHDEKYLLINQAFAGKQRLMPFFNRQNNDDLLLAIQSAGVARGRNGFRKDKGGEKLAETEEDLLEHRTDGTDAFDTLFIGCEKFPRQSSTPYNPSGIL